MNDHQKHRLLDDFSLEPKFEEEVAIFGKWLEEETKRQQKDVQEAITGNLSWYLAVLVISFFAVRLLRLADPAALLIHVTVCTFCLICAVKSLIRSILVSGFQRDMTLRWLGSYLHAATKPRPSSTVGRH